METPSRARAGRLPASLPPTDVEKALVDAKSRGDREGYIRVLLGTDTFVYVQLTERADGDMHTLVRPHRAVDGRDYIAVYTRGELLPRRPGLFAQAITLPAWTKGTNGMVVNPGTSGELHFPSTLRSRRLWKVLGKAVPRRGHGDALITKYTGPLQGPLAHGLACGTHLALHNQVIWNDVGDVFDDYFGDVAVLSDLWDVTDRSTWLRQLSYLLEGRNSPPEPEVALKVRRQLVRRHPGVCHTPQVWQQATADHLRERGAADAEIAAASAVIGQIARYEARFRTDGLLPPDGYVVSVLGYDYGRAVNFARWGLGARYAETAEATQAVIRAGELCRQRYASWEEFSAGYTLGRVLRFDEGSFGHFYDSALTPHRILTTEPSSPWRTIPFQQTSR